MYEYSTLKYLIYGEIEELTGIPAELLKRFNLNLNGMCTGILALDSKDGTCY